MPEEKIPLNIGGRQVQASAVEVNQSSERWNEYFLEDGTVLKMKLVLKKVYKIDNEFDAEGNPVYVMQSTNVTTVSASKNQKNDDHTDIS